MECLTQINFDDSTPDTKSRPRLERGINVIITTEQLKEIASAGGGFTIDASTMTFNQVRDITAGANVGKAKINIKNVSGLTGIQLKELASLAPGLVVFDFTT